MDDILLYNLYTFSYRIYIHFYTIGYIVPKWVELVTISSAG